MFGDRCSIFASAISPFKNNCARCLSMNYCKDPRSQINIWLEHLINSFVEVIEVSESWNVPWIIRWANTTSREPFHSHSNASILQNGELYFLYRSLLYFDYFNVANTLFSKGSVDACNRIILGLPYGNIKKRSAVKTLSLTPSGIFTKDVIDYFIPDIMKDATNRFIGGDAKGSSIRILMNFGGFLDDYPAASQVIEVMEHSAGPPCTLWTFWYQYIHGVPDFSYISDVSSGITSFTRSLDRLVLPKGHGLSGHGTAFW